MAFNGSGSFVRVHDWTTDLSNTVPVTASRMDAEDDGFATGLSTVICKDGQTTTTARIPFAAGVSIFDGTASAPGINFSSDTNSGFYRIGADNVGLALNGAKVVDYSTTGVSVTGTLASSGALTTTSGGHTITAGGLTVTDGGATITAGGLTVTAGGVTVNGGVIKAQDGTKTSPGYSWASDTDTGFYRIGANNIGISCGDTKIVDIATTGVSVTGSATISSGFTVSAGSVSLPAGSVANTALASPNALVLLRTQVASNSATIDFVHGASGVVLDDTYEHYLLILDNVIPASDAVGFRMRVGTGGTPTYETTGYDWATQTYYAGGSLTANAEIGGDAIGIAYGAANVTLGQSNVAGEGGLSGTIEFSNPEVAAYKVFRQDVAYFAATGTTANAFGSGHWKSGTAITAIRFYMTTGNITSGRFSLYGYTKS